ncbi:L(+)-tartrate dehydratase subunit alpha [Campylobacter majalis]|uniref:L(+)-tartrate dehydratase subunit alpha n=1 Tax=Campylobacter majalis TaxID=2790656 RepID=A0ABN7KC44_9BACT|nr:fumarate hydratase [Campylobacter majalis]CAD7288937.1 L(+)-tartrate dehydratase subunit alpha [Campylobacter majalis]
MKVINTELIKQAVSKLCKQICYIMPDDVNMALSNAKESERSKLGKEILAQILLNANLAKNGVAPICQDTGMVVVFIEIGQDVRLVGEYLEDAINSGVAQAYTQGYLRKSIVSEPLFERKNTLNNTPCIIHQRIVRGDKIRLEIGTKGFGSENKSVLKMLTPADGIDGVKNVFKQAVLDAGPNACPPLIIGVGIGGTMEKAAIMAKKAAFRSIDSQNQNPKYANLENELLDIARSTGIGPQGLGGDTTALKVNVEYFATHIAGLAVAININCHATRHAQMYI